MFNDLIYICQIIGKRQSKPVNKFIYQIMYGLVKSRSIRLSNIARTLNEPVLLYTEKRLHRNLYGKIDIEKMRTNYLRLVRGRINSKDYIMVLDLLDIRKEYAEKMERLSMVWDGSKKVLHNGYMVIQIEAISKRVKQRRNFPLTLELYSNNETKYKSDNQRVLEEIEKICKFFPGYIWVFDRGFDRKNIISELNNLPVSYAIRQVGLRNVMYRGSLVNTKKLAAKVELRYKVPLAYVSKRTGKIRYIKAKYNMLKVSIDGSSNSLIVLKMPKRPRLMLLTNDPDFKHVKEIIKAYIHRWGCEESTRFLKSREGFDIEDIRVMKYEGLKRMMTFVLFAYGFLCLLHDTKRKEVEQAIKENTKNFVGLPRFHYYRTLEAVGKELEKEARISTVQNTYNVL